MHLILDTSILIELERKNRDIENKLRELKSIYPFPPQISFMTYFEFLEGIAKKAPKNKEIALNLIGLFEILQTTPATAHNLVLLRQRYELPIPDLFIAAQVMEADGLLVTKDSDFEKIHEIKKILL